MAQKPARIKNGFLDLKAPALRAEAEALVVEVDRLQSESPHGPHVNLTVELVEMIAEAFGGEEDSIITIAFGEGYSGSGYYAWAADYPEEGSIYLGPQAE